ncbi:hypothetical protein ACWCXH_05330 [Kitasatospora sp. NPDC001660]
MGDFGPAAWLPADTGIRCAYAVRFAQVSLTYQLPVTEADEKAVLQQRGGRGAPGSGRLGRSPA